MHIQDLIAERLSRRGLLGGLAGLPLLSLAPACTTTETPPAAAAPTSTLTFSSVAATTADAVTVPPGYSARAVIIPAQPGDGSPIVAAWPYGQPNRSTATARAGTLSDTPE